MKVAESLQHPNCSNTRAALLIMKAISVDDSPDCYSYPLWLIKEKVLASFKLLFQVKLLFFFFVISSAGTSFCFESDIVWLALLTHTVETETLLLSLKAFFSILVLLEATKPTAKLTDDHFLSSFCLSCLHFLIVLPLFPQARRHRNFPSPLSLRD